MKNSTIKVDGNVWKQWEQNALKKSNDDAVVHWVAGEEPLRWSYSSLLKKANEFSLLLKENGIKRGEVCAIIIRHNFLFYPLYMGIVGLGAIPAVLAYPNPRLHPDKFRQGLEGMAHRSGLDWIFTERELEPIVRPFVEKAKSTILGLHFPVEWELNNSLEEKFQSDIDEVRSSIKGSDPFLLQHSSGTTGLQKPVLLSHRAVLEHVVNYGESIRLNDSDKVVSWLPLYHDMGLIAAFHISLAFGIPLIQIDPFEWVLAPVLLLEAASKEGATLCWLPNFAYNMLADKIRDDEMEGISLSSLRSIISCSEPVRYESHQKFISKFEKYGLRLSALSACYAMAETTFGITQTLSNEEIPLLQVDRDDLSKGRIKISDAPSCRNIVSSGKVIKGCEVKIVDENRKDVRDGFVGEVAIKSVSMFEGYRNYPEKTAEVLNERWFYSGDYGFKNEEDFYIIGRKKDIIIVAGKNIYPEDIEDTVGQVEGVIPGRVVAFGEEDELIGTEDVAVIAETKYEEQKSRKALMHEVVNAGMTIDVSIVNVYLVPPRWLIKSSAGKPSRKANKERISDKQEQLRWIVK